MNLRQLQAFRIVLDERSMTVAAQRFGVTQPAMSTLIGKLEDEIGFALFDRHKGRLRPTPEALRFQEEVDQALSGFEKVARAARDIRELNAGQLRIASLPGISMGFLPGVVADFAAEHPDVRLSLQTRSSGQVQEWMASQTFDVGISELPVDHPSINVEPLSFDCVCAMPEGHPLSNLDVTTPEDLKPYPLITLYPEHMTHFRLKTVFEDAGLPWRPHVECQIFAPACIMVARGVGVALIDPFTAVDFENRGVVTRPFAPAVRFDIGILFPALRPKSLLTEKFVRLLRDALAPYVRQRERLPARA